MEVGPLLIENIKTILSLIFPYNNHAYNNIIKHLSKKPDEFAKLWLVIRCVKKEFNSLVWPDLQLNLSSIKACRVLYQDPGKTHKIYFSRIVGKKRILFVCILCGTAVASENRDSHIKKCNPKSDCKKCNMLCHPSDEQGKFCPLKECHCKFCGLTFRAIDLRIYHSKHCGNIIDQQCKFCQKTFPRNSINSHLWSCIESYTFCTDCGGKIHIYDEKKMQQHKIRCKNPDVNHSL